MKWNMYVIACKVGNAYMILVIFVFVINDGKELREDRRAEKTKGKLPRLPNRDVGWRKLAGKILPEFDGI